MKPSVASLLVVCILARLSHAEQAGSNSSSSSSSTNEQSASIGKEDSIQVNLKLAITREKCLPDAIIPSCINCGGGDSNKKCLGLEKFDWLYKGCDCMPAVRAIACRYGIGPEWDNPGWVYSRPIRNASTRWHPLGPGRDSGRIVNTESGTETGGDAGSPVADTNTEPSNSSSATENPSETASETALEVVAKDCPPEDRAPSCVDCGGDDGTKKCLGLTESENQWKGCTCDPLGTPLWRDPQGRTMAQLLVIRYAQMWSALPETGSNDSHAAPNNNGTPSLTVEESPVYNKIPKSRIESDDNAVEIEKEVENCPPDDRTPSCINCGGDDGTQRCLGLIEHDNLWKGCRCIPHVKDHIHEVDWDEWEAMRQVLINLPLRSPQRGG